MIVDKVWTLWKTVHKSCFFLFSFMFRTSIFGDRTLNFHVDLNPNQYTIIFLK